MGSMLMPARIRFFTHRVSSLLPQPSSSPFPIPSSLRPISHSAPPTHPISATKTPLSDTAKFVRTVLFFPPGTDPEDVTDDMILPNSNIILGPYAGESKIKEVQFVGSSVRPKDCPKDDRPEFAMLGRSNVGKSSLINSLVRKKEVALTSKKPGKTQLINHFLVNKSWYLVDLPGYGFANAPEATRMDWSAFTKGYFLNRESLNSKGKRPDENIKSFQELIKANYKIHPPWIMSTSTTGLGRDDLLLHMSQLRNYWDN